MHDEEEGPRTVEEEEEREPEPRDTGPEERREGFRHMREPYRTPSHLLQMNREACPPRSRWI